MKIRRPRKSVVFAALAATTAIVLMSATTGSAIASAPSPNAPTPVQGGLSAETLPGATGFGTTPADTPEQVSFILRARNQAELSYHSTHQLSRFLTVSQFANVYGASPSVIRGLTSYLAGFGIETTVYPDGLDISTTGTAGEYDAALTVTQGNYHVPRIRGGAGSQSIPAQNVHANRQSPHLPYRLAGAVLSVLGLTNYGPFSSQSSHVSSAVAPKKSGSSDACEALTGLPDACNLPSDFAKNYGLNGLYRRGADGAGSTVAIVTLAALDPDAAPYYWQNIAHIPATKRTLTVTNVDGGPGDPSDASGSGETDIDVEQSGAVAPGANVVVYQSANTDGGFADSFFDAASQNIASSVSSSWGESETVVQALVASGEEPTSYAAAFGEAFEEFALQGQSGFIASADSGAYDSYDSLGTTNLSVDLSADSPYITSAGGTTLPWSTTFSSTDGTITAPVSVTAQRAWGWDYLWQPIATVSGTTELSAAESNIGGDGGGFSVLERTPSYQQGVSGTHTFNSVEYLTPIDYQDVYGVTEPTDWTFNPTPSVRHGYGTGRAEPDLSTDADPYTGYLLYEPSFAGVNEPVLQGGWGGTSFVAPQLNGSAAVIDSYLGHRVGFWNPAMYAAASGSNSPMTPLNTAGTSNDNLFYTGQPGDVYNQGTGLGIPNLTALAAHLASGH